MTHPPDPPSADVTGGGWLKESADSPPALSVIIPTRNEAQNISLLLTKLAAALHSLAVEIIFVDDSDDDTPATVRQVAPRYPFAIGLIARPPHRRANGLGGAVVEGFRMARSPWMCVMDADLQHPPATVRRLWEEAHRSGADLVMGTRLKGDGDTHGLSLHRNVVSRLLALTTRLTFPMRLWRVSDPLTGLFMLRNGSVDLDLLEPDGFKILLEILVRSPRLKLAEVPFRFDYRHAGESKASVAELRRLLRHYVRLRFSADIYLVRYVGVGLLSLLLNTIALWGGTEQLGWHYLWSVVIATQLSSLFSFALTERWVFDDRRQRGTLFYRFNGFMLLNNLLLPLRLPAIWLLVRYGVTGYLGANLLSIVALSLVRLIISDQILWQRLRNQPLNRTRRPFTPQPLTWRLHDLVTIRSEMALPLPATWQPLSDNVGEESADIVIQVRDDFRRVPEPGVWHYSDGLGRHGYCVDLHPGPPTRITVSPFLAHAPETVLAHLVQPVLRWLLAQRGHLLVQAEPTVQNGEAALTLTPDSVPQPSLVITRDGTVIPGLAAPPAALQQTARRLARWPKRLPRTSLAALWQRLHPGDTGSNLPDIGHPVRLVRLFPAHLPRETALAHLLPFPAATSRPPTRDLEQWLWQTGRVTPAQERARLEELLTRWGHLPKQP